VSVRVRRWIDPATGLERESWQIDIRWTHPDGRIQRIKKRSPIQTRRGAEQYEREVRQALLDGSYGAEAPAAMPTFEEFVPKFLTYSENNNKVSTLLAKKKALRDHLQPFFGKLPLDQIDLAAIEEFKALMRKTPSDTRCRKPAATVAAQRRRKNSGQKMLSLKFINNTLGILRKLLAVAHEHGVLATVPKVQHFKVPKPAFDYLTFQEADRLVAAADAEWRAALLLALKAGLRLGELLGLKWEDLDLIAGRVVVRRNICNGVINTPKGGRSREIPLSNSVVAALKQHRHRSLLQPFVFCDEKGNHLTPGAFKWPLYRALRKAGIARTEGMVGWHDLRHSFASHLVMKGQSLKAVQELLGHANIEMTMRYAHLSPEVKREAVQVLDETPASVNAIKTIVP
jgi:integrase